MAGQESICDEEIIYRRIPRIWFDESKNEVTPYAFKPRKGDIGLSVTRAQSESNPIFLNAEAVALSGMSQHGYYVACLQVRDLRSNGMDVIAKPLDDNPGHAEIPQLTHESRKSRHSQSLMALLAHELVVKIEGPFIKTP